MLKINIKIAAYVLLILYILMVIFFYDFYKHLVLKDAKHEVLTILNTTKAIRTYVENIQKPVIYKLKEENKLYKDFFDPRLLSSTFIVNMIHSIYQNLNKGQKFEKYRFKLAATNPRNPMNMANVFEKEILEKFRNKLVTKEFSTFIKKDSKEYFYVAVPIERNQRSCLKCHGDPKNAPKELVNMYGNKAGFYEKVGDLRAILSISVPISNIISSHIIDFFITIFIGLLFFIMVFIFLYIIDKKNKKLELKKEALLEKQNKLASLGRMIENIAHQWKQPLSQLSFILANISLRDKKGLLTKEILSEKIKEANIQIKYMSNTIDDFRNFLSEDIEKRVFDANELISLAIKLLGLSLEKNGIKLIKDLSFDFQIKGFYNEFVQALLNIINNSIEVLIDRGVENPTIVVKAYKVKNSSFIEIFDNGGGIDENIIDKIFDPYFTTKNGKTSTGIGLYMTKMIIEKNGGTISVKNLHNETHFIIKL